MAAHQALPSLGFCSQEHWSGLPFPSPMRESEKWKWSCSVVSDSLRPHGLQPPRLLHPWDFPDKSPGVGCHCLLRLSMLLFYIGVSQSPLYLFHIFTRITQFNPLALILTKTQCLVSSRHPIHICYVSEWTFTLMTTRSYLYCWSLP